MELHHDPVRVTSPKCVKSLGQTSGVDQTLGSIHRILDLPQLWLDYHKLCHLCSGDWGGIVDHSHVYKAGTS